MRTPLLVLVSCVALGVPVAAQQKPPELTGTLSFDVGSGSGRVESLAVQIGDGGTGRYKAILAGDPSLPTHAIYRPRDLGPFGAKLLLPIVAFGNGGCRNGSGEFRNFLSDLASHGYLIVAIGPAGDAVVAGSEGRTNQTQASQLLDGVEWATRENGRQGSDYFGKLDVANVAVMGQSCGTRQALEVSGDPRVKTTVLLNGGPNLGGGRGRGAGPAQTPAAASAAPTPAPPAGATGATGGSAQPAAPGESGTATPPPASMLAALDKMNRRYAPYAPALQPVPGAASPQAGGERPDYIAALHAPIALINGGPKDLAYNGAVSGYESVQKVTALHAWQDVGHYPATYRQPNGGAFAIAVNAWLDWHLKGDQSASKMFLGSNCGLCKDPKWNVQIKNVR